jgi:predicted extracellular nuclease
VEGTSSNKALELFNAGETDIDLGACRIELYRNGSANASVGIELPLGEILAPGDVFVICHVNMNQAATCHQRDVSLDHNGNDALGLVCDGELRDGIGQAGINPGTA